MEAFERFYALHPEWQNKVTYLQIAPKSRSEIPEYSDLEQAVGSAAGRINGKYGEVAWTPIRYLNRAYSRSSLAGLYRSARVGLVTPLRDGMNLVAKEYVAAQDADDPGASSSCLDLRAPRSSATMHSSSIPTIRSWSQARLPALLKCL